MARRRAIAAATALLGRRFGEVSPRPVSLRLDDTDGLEVVALDELGGTWRARLTTTEAGLAATWQTPPPPDWAGTLDAALADLAEVPGFRRAVRRAAG